MLQFHPYAISHRRPLLTKLSLQLLRQLICQSSKLTGKSNSRQQVPCHGGRYVTCKGQVVYVEMMVCILTHGRSCKTLPNTRS
jgi:hypothetical protein